MAQTTDNVFLTDQVSDLPRRGNYDLGETFSLVYCKAGNGTIILDDKVIQVEPHTLIVLSPNTYIRSTEYSPDIAICMLQFKSEIFDKIFMECFRTEPLWWEKRNFVQSTPVLLLTPYHQQVVEAYYQLLSTSLRGHDNNYHRQIRYSIAKAALLELLNYIDEFFGEHDQDNITQRDYLFHRFVELLQNNKYQREVQWYAEQMGITPKYLSEICKQRSGKSASEWIADVTISEIKILLTKTGMSVKEIAYQMQFPNSSFFCQYVKKHCGMTPIKLRRLQ